MRRCVKCKEYTLKEECGNCRSETSSVHPPRYSHEDKYAKYRRKAKFGAA